MRTVHLTFRFFRGTTPTLAFRLPLRLYEGDSITLTFSQDYRPVLELSTAQLILDKTMLYAVLTQKDTLSFAPGTITAQLRWRCADGTAGASEPFYGAVEQISKEGELT